MSSTTAPAAATGLPEFDPDHFDLGLVHLARLLDLIVSRLCEIDRDEAQAARPALMDLDTLSWTARALAEQLQGQFEPHIARFRSA